MVKIKNNPAPFAVVSGLRLSLPEWCEPDRELTLLKADAASRYAEDNK